MSKVLQKKPWETISKVEGVDFEGHPYDELRTALKKIAQNLKE